MEFLLVISNSNSKADFAVTSERNRTLCVSLAVQVSDCQCRLSRSASIRGVDAR
jgi:hypothetical protein